MLKRNTALCQVGWFWLLNDHLDEGQGINTMEKPYQLILASFFFRHKIMVVTILPIYVSEWVTSERNFDATFWRVLPAVPAIVCRYKSQTYLSASNDNSIIWRADSSRRRNASPQLSGLPNDGVAVRWRQYKRLLNLQTLVPASYQLWAVRCLFTLFQNFVKIGAIY